MNSKFSMSSVAIVAIALAAVVPWTALGAAGDEILSVKPGITVQWHSEVGRSYRLWCSDSLGPDAEWQQVGPMVNGDGQIMSDTDIGSEDRAGILDTAKRFYKLEVRSAITCNLRVEFDRTATGAPAWLYTSRVCDPTSYVPITVYNDGCVPVYCVNVELYWTAWNGCSNIYKFYHMDSCRLAKLSIRKIESMGAVKVKIPWHPKQICNSMKVRVDPDDKDLDPWGAPIPCYWHNPAYPLGHIIEPDDCNWDDVPDTTGRPANDNWDSTKGNIPRLRLKYWTIIPLPIPNPRLHDWQATLAVDPASLAVYSEMFPGVEIGLGTPTPEVEAALERVRDLPDIDVQYSPDVALDKLILEGKLARSKQVTVPRDKINQYVLVVRIPGPIPDPPPEILPEFQVAVQMADWFDEQQVLHPGHLMFNFFLPELLLVD